MLSAPLLNPAPEAALPAPAPITITAAAGVPPVAGARGTVLDRAGPGGAVARAVEAVTRESGGAARPMLALTDTAPPPPGLLAAGPAAVTLVDAAPDPAALAVAPAALDQALVRLVALTNAERVAAGVAPLAGNAQLTVAAQRYADVMADTACFGQACGPLPRLGDRAWAAGDARWGYLGENVAAGQPTPERAVAAWMASPTHRDVLLDPEFTLLGVGLVVGGPYGIYWTQEFGTPSAGAPVAAPAPPPAAVDVGMAQLNTARAGAGLRPLRLDLRLVQVAEGGAAPGAAPTATGAEERGAAAGAGPEAPIAVTGPAGQASAGDAVAAWLVTAHDLLLDPAFADAGVGVVAGAQGPGTGRVHRTDSPADPAATA